MIKGICDVKDTGGRRIFCKVDENNICEHEQVEDAYHHEVVISRMDKVLIARIYILPGEKWDFVGSRLEPGISLAYYQHGSLVYTCMLNPCGHEEVKWDLEQGYHTFMKKNWTDNLTRVFVARNRDVENKTCGVERIKRVCECNIDDLPV